MSDEQDIAEPPEGVADDGEEGGGEGQEDNGS